MMIRLRCLVLPAAVLCCSLWAQEEPETAVEEYLGDRPELVFSASQAWGELGWNVAAHAPGQAGALLQIGDKTFSRGLGHHANGSINVLLKGEYSAFDAEVGLQPCPGGSVIFRVFVDGQQRFDSGVLQMTNAPMPVHVELTGAQELRLEANDAGDGITCDMANWINARVTRANAGTGGAPELPVDIAAFARVVTWDPNRNDGARASRIEEFRVEDIFLETDLPASRDGTYRVPVSTNGLACIGLQWLNRRALKELALEFPAETQVPVSSAVRVQGWVGESAWQGSWRPLAGELHATGGRLVYRLSPTVGPVQTQKIRWVFPANGEVAIRDLSAFTYSHWETASLFVEAERPAKNQRGELTVCNGEFLASSASRREDVLTRVSNSTGTSSISVRLQLKQPLHLSVRYSRPSMFKSDPTVLQFRLPAGSFAVAVEDVLSQGCVYLPDFGVFVSRDPAPTTLAAYKRQIAGRKTILQQVRELPDQTFEQAMARTHHDAQREGPVMLSLACDNTKFVVERDGTLHFQATTNLTDDWFATAGMIRPQFGDAQSGTLSRRLDGGWLPIPIISVERKGVRYVQRTFVAPVVEAGGDTARLNRPSICVVEYTITNTLSEPAYGSLSLACLADSRHSQKAVLMRSPGGYSLEGDGAPFALANTDAAQSLNVYAEAGELKLGGRLSPHASASFAVLIAAPGDRAPAPQETGPLRAATKAYWNAVLAPAMQVETPDALLNTVIRSSQVRCLIAARNEAGGARIAPWIAAMSYGPLESEANSVIRGMAFMGHEEFARRGLDYFIHRYNTNGFLTTGYTTFGTAWHLWTLGEFCQLYHDTDWLRGVTPEIERVVDWIVRQTEKTKRPGRPEYGLMPPGVMADWNAFAYHYAMNAYYYAALREVGTALSSLREGERPREPKPSWDAKESGLAGTLAFPPKRVAKHPKKVLTDDPSLRISRLALDEAATLRTNIIRAYRWTQAQSPALPLRNGTWIPHYPSQVHSPGKLADFFPGQDAGRSWCYDVEIGAHQLVPTGVFEPRDREVERMLDHMEDVQFLANGWFDYPAAMNEKDWFNLGGFSKVQPYYTRNCEVYALRDEVKPFVRSYFNTLAAMLNPEVLTFWEHFHHSGAWDKTHETGYFLHQTRTLLVTERGDQLWLAPFITDSWLKDGQTLIVSNAPTRFGSVSYHLESHLTQGYVRATIHPPTRQVPSRIVLRLRHPEGGKIRSIRVNGKPQRDFDKTEGLVRLKPTGRSLELQVFYSSPKP